MNFLFLPFLLGVLLLNVNVSTNGKIPLVWLAFWLTIFLPCKSGNEAIVRYLVEHGADINKEDRYSKTPLSMALEYKNEEVVRYLKELGAKINKFIENGEI